MLSKLVNFFIALMLIPIVFSMSSCSSAEKEASYKKDISQEPTVQLNSAVADANVVAYSTDKKTGNISSQRKIIKNASISLCVENMDLKLKEIDEILLRYNGLIASKNISSYDENKKNGNLILWIPSEKVVKCVDEINKIGKLLNSDVRSEDISNVYMDMVARINNLKKQENRLLELLSRKDTALKEVLELEQELRRIRTEIEGLEGQKNLYDKQVEYATITINMSEDKELYNEPDDIIKPLRIAFKNIKSIFLYSLSLIIEIISYIIKIVVFIIPWSVILLLIFVLWKYFFKKIIKIILQWITK